MITSLLDHLAAHPQTGMLWATGLVGLIFGLLAQWSRFCLLRGLIDWWEKQQRMRLNHFLLAMASALLGTQLLLSLGWIHLDGSLYPRDRVSIPALALGSLMFGYGMAMANACGARSLVLLASGNLRSLITLMFLALGAGMALSGLLAPLRLWLEQSSLTTLPGRQLPDFFLALGFGPGWSQWLPTLGLGLGLAWIALKDPQVRHHQALSLAAILIGLLVPAAWWVTATLGADDFNPLAPASLTFIAPVADTQQYLLFSTGSRLSFGILLVTGVFFGALLRALISRTFAWQGFETRPQLTRALLGGFLMGVGGVLALGCSVGQGLTGFSTLALASLPALLGIPAGAWLYWRINRSRTH